jgi:hypothetical protein
MLLASSIASSNASLVPDPIEKCAVCAASPISTTGPRRSWCTQDRHTTRGNRIHCEEPRRWRALDISGWPSRWRANSCSQKAMDCSFSIWSSPAARQTRSGVSTMKVEVSRSKR